jgi:hypothetical protein
MSKKTNTLWSLMALFALGCGGRIAPEEDVESGGTRSGSGSGSGGTKTLIAPPPLAAGGATAVTTWSTTTAAYGGYATTTVLGSGGVVTTTTAIGTCSTNTNLIAEAAWSISGNWIGADPASTLDNPCGVQGAIYAYSDDGVDNVAGTGDDTLQYPAIDPENPSRRQTPCVGGQCCISGITAKWPIFNGAADYTASVWGAGIGLSLNDPGNGGAKLPYAGFVKGFAVSLAGALNGQVLRLTYSQRPNDSAAPFREVLGVGTYSVTFGEVTCPTWGTCTPPTPYPYDLQVMVVGGDTASAYLLCVTSIRPLF